MSPAVGGSWRGGIMTKPTLPRWEDGPPGFLPKANQHLDEIEGALSSVPTPPRQVRRGRQAPDVVAARITGYEAIGDNRYKYAWAEAYIVGDAFSARPGANPLVGTLSAGYAINGAEAGNSDAGLQSNGIDLDGQIFTDNDDLTLQPIPVGSVVMLLRVFNSSTGAAWMFDRANLIDGECAA